MNDDEEPMDNWKQFQGSELGSLMAGIYGGKKHRPNISYPKPKQKATSDPGKWRPVVNNPNAVDPRKTTRRNIKVNVPKNFGPKREGISMIDLIPKRKNEETIMNFQEDQRMRMQHYRPAHRRITGGDEEKERLSQVFGHKGGVCLPEELRGIESEAPYEIEKRMKKQKQIAERQAIINQRKGIVEPVLPRELGHTENMQNQIAKEIDERVDYLETMQQLKQLKKADEKKIENEIKTRIMELHKLQKLDP